MRKIKNRKQNVKRKYIFDIHFLMMFSVFIGIAFGIVFTILAKKYSSFMFSNELDYLSLISILLTLFVSIYIAKILDKRNVIQTGSKEIYTEFFKDFLFDFSEGVERLIIDGTELSSAPAFFKLKRMKINNMKKFAETQNFMKDCECIEEVIKYVDEIYALITGDNFIENVQGENIHLNVRKKNMIRIKLIEFEKAIYQTIFEINKV